MAPAHALLLLGATADLFCSLVPKPDEKDADPLQHEPTPPGNGDSVPEVKISPSTVEQRKASICDFSFKQKLSSYDSLNQQKVYRAGSQTKRKISPSDVLPRSRMSISEPKFQRRISLSEMPHGQVMSSRSVPVPPARDASSQNGRGSQGKLSTSSARRPSYQFRSLSTEIPSSSHPSKHRLEDPLSMSLSSKEACSTSSESEIKISFNDISPVSYNVRNFSRDS